MKAPSPHSGEPWLSKASSSDQRLGHVGVRMGAHGQLAGQLPGVGQEGVGAQSYLAGLVVGGHQSPCLLGSELLPPQLGDPLWMGMLDGGFGRGGVAERVEQCRAPLTRSASQDGVDQTVTAPSPLLGQLDGIGHDRVVG